MPGQLHSCSPEPSWRIIHAWAATAALLQGIKETSGLQAQGWGSWLCCLLDGLLRTLRAPKEMQRARKSRKPREALSQGGLWVDVCVGGWQNSRLPRAPLEPGESFLPGDQLGDEQAQ